MAWKVADLLWEMLANAGVRRCYGIVGDALNPVIDGLQRNGKIEFIVPFHAAQGYTLSLAKQVLNSRLDTVIKTIEHNVRLV